ncbi:MAG: DUF58 domain-containing protein [Melioribacteraceae bacterium]|nr:DUF58 domain-containing protein [Melioribacteraceae bacterium]
MVGLHKSPYHGFSAEFSQHRPYMQGDPLKNIDWNVWAKSDKYYIKQYEEETNLLAHVVFDKSKSMDYKHTGAITKFEYGKILAGSLIYILQKQQDSVGLALYADSLEKYFPPKTTSLYLKTLLAALENTSPAQKTDTSKCLNLVAEKVQKRGLVIIISDLFDSLDSVITALKHFHYKKNEVIVFQILDPIEKSFAFDNEAVFKDLETKEEITTQPYQIQAAYKSAVSDFIESIKSECLNLKIDFNQITTDQSFDKALINFFNKRKRLH